MKSIILCVVFLVFLSGVFFLLPDGKVSSQSGRTSNSMKNAVNWYGSEFPPVDCINSFNAHCRAAEAAQRTANSVNMTTLGQRPRVTTRIIRENNPRQRITITARYPQISIGASARSFNALAERLVRQRISSFKSALYPPSGGDRTRELVIGYKTAFLDSRLISIQFGAGWDSGGVHPNSDSFVLNYDLRSQRQLALYDLFRPDSSYLRTISDYCIQQLRNIVSDYGSLRDGAAPSLENYRSWVISRSGLQITFDAYQVASYAEGPQTVLVPWSVLRGQPLPNGPVSDLIE